MPVTKSAKKKLQQDKKREYQNSRIEETLRRLVKKAKKKPTEKGIIDAIKSADKAAKKNVIHKNKAARIKSKLSKLIKKEAKKTTTVPKKTSSKKQK